MAPSGRTKTTTRRKPSRSQFKKQHPQSRKQEISTGFSATCSSISSEDSSKDRNMDSHEVAEVSTSACSTPKGQKFRIPEVSTCPPAPKKPRVVSNFSLRRSPLALFAPPDLEIFFCVALPDVSVSFVC